MFSLLWSCGASDFPSFELSVLGARCVYRLQAVTRAEGEALARRYKMPFFETSAKKDIGVTEVRTAKFLHAAHPLILLHFLLTGRMILLAPVVCAARCQLLLLGFCSLFRFNAVAAYRPSLRLPDKWWLARREKAVLLLLPVRQAPFICSRVPVCRLSSTSFSFVLALVFFLFSAQGGLLSLLFSWTCVKRVDVLPRFMQLLVLARSSR